MHKNIEEELREAQLDGDILFLEPAAITDAGRNHLLQMKAHSVSEIYRLKALIEGSSANTVVSLQEDIDLYTEFIEQIDEAVSAPDERWHDIGLAGVFDKKIELIYRDHDGFNKIAEIPRHLWDFLGQPQVIHIQKQD